MEDLVNTEVLGLTAEIIAALVGHNQVAAAHLPAMIQLVYRSLANVGRPYDPRNDAPTPAVSIKRSVFPDYIVCLEDSKKLKMLKRHLQTSYGLTPADYRAKWGLPPDYPMVAPSYASTRPSLTKSIGSDGSDRLCRVSPVRPSRPNRSTLGRAARDRRRKARRGRGSQS